LCTRSTGRLDENAEWWWSARIDGGCHADLWCRFLSRQTSQHHSGFVGNNFLCFGRLFWIRRYQKHEICTDLRFDCRFRRFGRCDYISLFILWVENYYTMKTLALIAHDGKKAEMVAFVKDHVEFLRKAKLVATGTTGSYIQQTGLEVELKLSGPKGGDAQIAALAAEGSIDGIIFFRDPLGKHPHEPDIQMLMRICDLWNVPLATNPATGSLIIEGLLEHE